MKITISEMKTLVNGLHSSNSSPKSSPVETAQ